MNPAPRILLIAASALLALMYVFPLWDIHLRAPQYPEGLGMKICVNKVVGGRRHDIANINILNHYIGMAAIDENVIPELRIMPWAVGFLIAIGLAAGLSGSIYLGFLWIGAFALSGLAGFFDFFRWEYNYGHHLNPEAPIKIPGMSYQPPLIGTKQLLNITASSFPGAATWVALLSAILGIAALALALKKSKMGKAAVAAFLFPLLSSCGGPTGQIPIQYGHDTCMYCNMTITDARYAAEIITKKGKTYTFDSVTCLVSFMLNRKLDQSGIKSIWIADYAHKGIFLDATKAFYLEDAQFKPPMGLHFAAFGSAEEAKGFSGEAVKQWQDVILEVKEHWLQAKQASG